MTRFVVTVQGIVAMFLAGCGDPGRLVRVIGSVGPDGALGLTDVELSTLTSVEAVRGEVAGTRGGATLVLTPDLPEDGGAGRDDVVRGDRDVHAQWVMDGRVVVPADFDSLAMLSAYAHLERAALHFLSLGVSTAADTVPLYYNPHISDQGGLGFPSTDNAAYIPGIDSFVVLPMILLQEIPLSMNPGVLSHEYAHRVWYFELWDGQLFTTLAQVLDTPGALNAWNRLRATDEGLADFFAGAVSGDPRFLAHSVHPGQRPEVSDPRDLTVVRTLDAAWLGGLEPLNPLGVYDPYIPGAVVSSTLWGLGELTGVAAVEQAVIDAQNALSPQLRASFTYDFGAIEAEIIARLPAGERPTLCARARQSYEVAWGSFGSVCP